MNIPQNKENKNYPKPLKKREKRVYARVDYEIWDHTIREVIINWIPKLLECIIVAFRDNEDGAPGVLVYDLEDKEEIWVPKEEVLFGVRKEFRVKGY